MTNPAATVRRGVDRLDRLWRDLPLRTRLTTAAALSAALAITAVVSVAYVATRHELRGQMDKQLRHQVQEVRIQGVNPFIGPRNVSVETQVGDIGGYAQVIDRFGNPQQGSAGLPVTSADVQVAAAAHGTVFHDGSHADQHVRIITKPLPHFPGYALQIALPLTAVDHQLGTLAAAFAILALGGLALTIFLSWAAVRRVTRPVRTLTETAEKIAATRDLTLRIATDGEDELGRLATSFNTMLDALERSVTAQRQLVTDASHELRTPLASLRTNAEVLNDIDRLTPEQRRAVLSGIVTQLDELTGLVADVVELARGDAPPSDHEEVQLDELVVNAVERARRHWPGVTFRMTTTPVAVRGVARRLDRAVANMLDNAGKFSPANTTVEVVVRADGTVAVADRGPGVPDEALPHVFDRFYRADEARALPGSGLGLAIAQQVAEGHGGTISLANRSGGGAVATLALPPAHAAAAPPGDRSVQPTVPSAEVGPSGRDGDVPMPVEESLFR